MISQGEGGVYLDVHVQPGARRSGVVGRHGDRLKLAVAAPPVGGRANEAVVEAVAELLGARARDVALVAGHGSRRKRLFVSGIDAPHARRRVEAALPDARNS